MIIFYQPDIDQNHFLSENESRHCIKALRKSNGDLIQLVDGEGGMYSAKITEPDSKKCQFEIIEKKENYGKRDFYVHIVLAPTKNTDRIEGFVEKAVEIGIDEISFIRCERSERKILKINRLVKIAVSAMKQSQKAYLPKINELIDYQSFIKKKSLPSNTFIAHAEQGNESPLMKQIQPKQRYCIIIGPEGDFTEKELAVAFENKIQPVSLGPYRLRTETAALAACHTVNLVNY